MLSPTLLRGPHVYNLYAKGITTIYFQAVGNFENVGGQVPVGL